MQKKVYCHGISASTHWQSSPKRIVGIEEPIMMLQQDSILHKCKNYINPKSCPFMIYLNIIPHVLHHYWFSSSNNSCLFFHKIYIHFLLMLISNSILQMNVCWNQRQHSIYNSHFGKCFFIDCLFIILRQNSHSNFFFFPNTLNTCFFGSKGIFSKLIAPAPKTTV